MTDYERDAALAGETLTDLRNQAIHMYLGATQAIARAAVKLAAANLADFEARWTPLGGGSASALHPNDVSCLPWDALCRLCGLDSLPLTSKERA